MTKEEIAKIKEHIEIHAKLEPRAIRITEILRRAVIELERIAGLEKENIELKKRLIKVENAYKRKFEAEWRLNDLYQKLRTDYANASRCSREYLTRYITMKELNIKAKEIIKDCMIVVKGGNITVCGVPEENRSINVLKLNEQAEQFLSEVENDKLG